SSSTSPSVTATATSPSCTAPVRASGTAGFTTSRGCGDRGRLVPGRSGRGGGGGRGRPGGPARQPGDPRKPPRRPRPGAQRPGDPLRRLEPDQEIGRAHV